MTELDGIVNVASRCLFVAPTRRNWSNGGSLYHTTLPLRDELSPRSCLELVALHAGFFCLYVRVRKCSWGHSGAFVKPWRWWSCWTVW